MRTRNSVDDVNGTVSETQVKINSFNHSSAIHETEKKLLILKECYGDPNNFNIFTPRTYLQVIAPYNSNMIFYSRL